MNSEKPKLVKKQEEDSHVKSITSDRDMKDEVYQVSEATNEDGTIDVEIIDVYIDESDNTAEIVFDSVTQGTKSETVKWPKVESREYKLVRIAEDTIGDFSQIGQISGERISADPDTWELKPEGKERKLKDRLEIMNYIGLLAGATGMIMGIFLAILIPMYNILSLFTNINSNTPLFLSMIMLTGLVVLYLIAFVVTNR